MDTEIREPVLASMDWDRASKSVAVEMRPPKERATSSNRNCSSGELLVIMNNSCTFGAVYKNGLALILGEKDSGQ